MLAKPTRSPLLIALSLALDSAAAATAGCGSSSSPSGGFDTGGSAAVGSGGSPAPGTGGKSASGGATGTGGGQPAGTGGAPQASGGSPGSPGSASGGSPGSGGAAATGTGGSDAGAGGQAVTASGGTGVGGKPGGGTGGAPVGAGGKGGPVTHNELILYDDAGGRLLYVNNANPSANWTNMSGSGRDMQLIGGGKVMLGKSDGWDEYLLSTGAKSGGVHGIAGTQTVHRMADGNTICATAGAGGIVLKMVDATGQVKSMITYAGFNYVRMARPTAAGTFMVAADTVAFEGDATGKVLSQATIPGGRHTWKAMRLANGNFAVTSGYGATLLVYDSTWKLLQTMGGKNQPNAAAIAPEFYADFHLMPNGNFFVVNSQADRTMDNSIQLLEYDPSGALVWQQKQPTGVHSLEEAIVLDGLDTTKLYIEPEGMLIPAP